MGKINIELTWFVGHMQVPGMTVMMHSVNTRNVTGTYGPG